MRLPLLAIAYYVLTAALPLAAQTTPPAATGPAVPTEGHERLGFFVGDWTVAGLPAAREFSERCAWMEGGRRHVICHSRSRAADGSWRAGYSIFSYRSADSTYQYHGFRSGGAVEVMEGVATADGWSFETESGSGAERTRVRVTITKLPDGGFRLDDAMAIGDGPFAPGGTTLYQRLTTP